MTINSADSNYLATGRYFTDSHILRLGAILRKDHDLRTDSTLRIDHILRIGKLSVWTMVLRLATPFAHSHLRIEHILRKHDDYVEARRFAVGPHFATRFGTSIKATLFEEVHFAERSQVWPNPPWRVFSSPTKLLLEDKALMYFNWDLLEFILFYLGYLELL